VQFRRCNLVDTEFFRDVPPFDVVFCRNVLIYFDAVARQRVLANLRRCLAPDGVFFSGHADSLPMLDPGFVSVGPPGAFAYRYRTAPTTSATRSPIPRRRTSRTRAPVRVTAPGLPMSAPVTAKAATPVPALPSRATPDPLLTDARRLADAGVLAESESLCRDFLQKRGPHPEAFLLLGQLAAARGQVREAENLYRKAVYLDEKHPEALAHLALLAERRGDRAAATRLRQRART
jgi:chemotaxis protein methyltransferase WspC